MNNQPTNDAEVKAALALNRPAVVGELLYRIYQNWLRMGETVPEAYKTAETAYQEASKSLRRGRVAA